MSRKKILWLPSWYPNRTAPFNGDFIKRHAEAVSLYEDVQVLYVVRDADGSITKDIHTEEFEKNGLSEKIIYYYSSPSAISLADKYFSEKRSRQIYKQAIADYIKKSGEPDLTHVHVGMKAGAIALWLKKEKNIRYIISEHWSGFLPEAQDKINDQPFYIQSLWKKVISRSNSFSAVSRYLADAMIKKYQLEKVEVIPNVVDATIFYPLKNKASTNNFIHISGLEALKNADQIIKGFFIVKKSFPEARLDIFGPENDAVKKIVQESGMGGAIQFHKEIPQTELADYVRKSAALILYSSYETFGCVIIEANACAIPVIVSDIPVFHETVSEGMNGLFAEANNVTKLSNKMIKVIENQSAFNSALIAAESEKYSYSKIGKQFSDWYNEVLKKN